MLIGGDQTYIMLIVIEIKCYRLTEKKYYYYQYYKT